MNSYINTNNLIKEPSDGSENLTISCNYNLLNNDNTVRWNGDEITLLKPYGLSNVKKICFRGFKGDLLPFTSIDLPKFKVEVVLTGANVSEAIITGKDGIYGESKYYNITNRDGNILLTFDKAWTYDVNEDNQLLYNIKEAIAEVNRRLKVMYPFKTFYNEFDLSETYDADYINKIYFDPDIIPINNNPGSSVLGYSKSKNKYVMIHINNSGEYEQVDLRFDTSGRTPIYASMSYDRNICLYMSEYSSSYYGLHYTRVNIRSEDNVFNYNWNLDFNRAEDHTTTNNNYFNFYNKSPSCCMSTVNNKNSVCLSPVIGAPLTKRFSVILYDIKGSTQTKSEWWLDFTQIAKGNIVNILAYGDVVDKNGNTIDNLLSILAVYIDINETSNDIYTIGYFELNKSDISGFGGEPTVIIQPVASKIINASEWNDRCKLMTCGKECYGVVKAVDTDKTYIWFKGVWVLSYANYDIDEFYLAEGYKYDDNNLFMFSSNSDEWVLTTAFFPPGTNIINWIKDIIYYKGEAPLSTGGNPVLKGINPPLFIRGSQNSIKGIVSNPETYNTEFPNYSVDNPKYLNYSRMNNALKCETEVELDMNVKGKDMNGNVIETLIDTNYVITDSYNFFEFNDEGNVKTSQICLTNNSVINMALKITTDPYYFEFITPIDYYTSEKFSLIHPIVTPVFNTINEHVLNTIETLILLHYEYNNISLVSSQFPNIDGTIFYINEDSYVDFKTMAIDNTVDGIRIKLQSENESLSLTELKALYGKLCVAIDWIQ